MTNFEKISDEDGSLLVREARKIVSSFLKTRSKLKLDDNFKSRFSFNAGVFVTLNSPLGLRGCIGYPLPDRKLHDALVDASIAAAVDDPRFSSVKYEELDSIMFEVTVLTPPRKIEIDNPIDYPSKIKVGRDGLIIKNGFSSGLLLPQVPVEYGWNEREFLENTCEKAGLPRDFWKRKDTEVHSFEGIVFKEEKPNGKIIREEL